MFDERFAFPHFQDIMCGYVSFNGVGERHADRFARALTDFKRAPGARRVIRHAGPSYVVYTTSNPVDLAISEGGMSCFVGYASTLSSISPLKRGLSEFFASSSDESFCLPRFLDSRYSGITLFEDRCRLTSDWYGKKKLFYKVSDDTVYFSNEMRTLLSIDSNSHAIEKQALRDYLTFNAIIGEKTISATIKSTPMQGFVEFTKNGDALEARAGRWARSQSFESRTHLRVDEVIANFNDAIEFYHRDLGYTHSDLSGGADSRLNLGAALDRGIPIVFNCETEGLEEDETSYFDYETVKILRKSLRFNFVPEVKGPFRSNSTFRASRFDTHRNFDGDMYFRTLSGLFGGKVFGGWGLGCFVGDGALDQYRRADQLYRDQLPEEHTSQTRPSLQEFRFVCEGIEAVAKEFFGSLHLAYGTSAFFDGDHWEWFEPYIIGNRKISAFLADSVLDCFDFMGVEAEVKDFKFYKRIYRERHPNLAAVPFNSVFTQYLSDPNLDIRNRVSAAPTFNSGVGSNRPVLGVLERKLKVLSEWCEGRITLPVISTDRGSDNRKLDRI